MEWADALTSCCRRMGAPVVSRAQTSMSPSTFLLVNRDHFSINTNSVVVAAPVNHTFRSRWRSARDSLHPDSTTSVGFGIPSGKTHASGSFLVDVYGARKPSQPVMKVNNCQLLEKREEKMLLTRRGQDA